MTYDVLVVGAGLAGTTAALAAARAGARVALASSGATFSGSSFFGGTWGLGLVGPLSDDSAGEKDLVDAICEVGRGVAVRPLAEALVGGMDGAVRELEARGVELTRAERADERDFIPCFDRGHRDWHGLGRESYRKATERALTEAGVALLPQCDLLDLVREGATEGGRVCGAALFERGTARVRVVAAGAVVLATGGFGGLFERTLTMPDVTGTAQAVALAAGARLVNVEFMQIMSGLVEPVRNVVFNERTFKYARVEGFDAPGAAELLDARSEHGPFSASLPDHVIDLALVAAGERGAAVSYELPRTLPEFMQTYFSWFSDAFGRSPAEGIRIRPYAHAANGGILVDERARCSVDGLFAAGEATGGMHGADRIGGMASANALVFGQVAGREAAAWAAAHPSGGATWELEARGCGNAGDVLRDLRHLMGEKCLVVRTAEGLAEAARGIEGLRARLDAAEGPCEQVEEAARAIAVRQALTSASALVAAMTARTESRGAHYRADFPSADSGQAHPNVVSLEDGELHVRPLGDVAVA